MSDDLIERLAGSPPAAAQAEAWRKAATIAARIYAHGVEAYLGDEWDAFAEDELREVAALVDDGERRPARPVQPAQAGATGRVAGGRIACPTCGGTEGLVLGAPGGVSCPRCWTGIYAIPDPASADHRIAEAAREWARALRAWRRQCDDVIAYEAADLELSALRRAEGALFDALVEEGSK